MVVARHYPESWVSLADLGRARPYQPTVALDAELEAGIQRYLEAPRNGLKIDIGIRGSLQPADAAKLYELAATSPGDILELGSGDGLSASVMTEAIRDAGSRITITSIDLDPAKTASAKRTLGKLGRLSMVDFVTGEAAEVSRGLATDGRRFGFVFVDHAHGYEPVLAACQSLPALVARGGFVLFHDFNDRRNRTEDDADYGVYQAVRVGLPPDFLFSGVFGCCGLYQHGQPSD